METLDQKIKARAVQIESNCRQNNNCDPNIQPFPKRQISDSSKLKEFTDNNFKFDENDRKFSKWVENTVGKG